MNYGQLKTQVTSTIARGDVPVADMVALAEAEIRRDVRVMAMESLTTGVLVAGVVALPARLLEVSRLVVGGFVRTYVSPEMYQDFQANQARDRVFTRLGDELHVLNGAESAYSLLALESFPALAVDSDVNWVLTNSPDVYLYGSLKHAAVWVKDAAAASGYAQLYAEAVAKTNSTDKAARFAGSLTARPRVVA